MTDNQVLHISMLNSFNLITGRATFDEIMDSGVGFFSHMPTQAIDSEVFKLIIWYFQDREMFEYCAELSKIYKEIFNEDGTPKEVVCECEYPDIETYVPRAICSICNNTIRR
jgi:hypothetical protein